MNDSEHVQVEGGVELPSPMSSRKQNGPGYRSAITPRVFETARSSVRIPSVSFFSGNACNAKNRVGEMTVTDE